MSDHNLAQLANSNFNAIRQLRADHDDLKARFDSLCTKMNAFREEATRLLTEMSQAHKPQERESENTCKS